MNKNLTLLTQNPKFLLAKANIHKQAIFDAILSERASKRKGNHKVKNRAEVSGTGKKPWVQKGTGRARAGSTRNPIFVGGGRAFGPTPERNYLLKVNKKVKKLAFKSAWSALFYHQNILILEPNKTSYLDLVNDVPKTKSAYQFLVDNDLVKYKKIILVSEDPLIWKSFANLKQVVCKKVFSLLVEDLVGADKIILTGEHLKILERNLT